jgi:hypothetical protein
VLAGELLVHTRVRTISIAIAALASAAACTEQPPRGTGTYIESHVESYDLPGGSPGELDVLFVVDDTAAMSPYATQVASLPAQLESVLSDPDGNLPNTRIAVITANAANAAFRQPAGTTEPYLEVGLDAHFDPISNISGSIAEALAPMLDVGTAGTDPVAPLEAVKAALDGQPAFLRPYSYVGVITIAASDDASAGPIAGYVTGLKARRADPISVVVTGAYPRPAARLDAFHNAFPNRNWVVDVDSSDWSDLVSIYAQLSRSSFGGPCIIIPADLDPVAPGPQYDCAFGAYYADKTSEVLPPCTDGGPARCWKVVPDPFNCFDEAYATLEVEGYPGRYRPTVRGECVVEGL